MGIVKFLEYMSEGVIGTLVVLAIPAVVLFLDRNGNHERRHHLSALLEDHFLDRLIALAKRKGEGSS